jgi:hypothetical protein
MFEFLAALGGFWFLLFAVVIIVGGVVAAESDSIVGALITFVAMFVGFYFLFDFPFEVGLFDTMFMVVIGVIAYIGVGLLYGIPWRYRNWLIDMKENIKYDYNNYADGKDSPTIAGFRASRYYNAYRPKSNLDKISAWIALWPWALFWDCCHRPIRFIYNTTYDIAAKFLDAVGNRTTDSILK